MKFEYKISFLFFFLFFFPNQSSIKKKRRHKTTQAFPRRKQIKLRTLQLKPTNGLRISVKRPGFDFLFGFCKLTFFLYLYFFLFFQVPLPSSTPAPPPSPHSTLHWLFREGKTSSGKTAKSVPSPSWGRTKPYPTPPLIPCLGWARSLSKENGFHEVTFLFTVHMRCTNMLIFRNA